MMVVDVQTGPDGIRIRALGTCRLHVIGHPRTVDLRRERPPRAGFDKPLPLSLEEAVNPVMRFRLVRLIRKEDLPALLTPLWDELDPVDRRQMAVRPRPDGPAMENLPGFERWKGHEWLDEWTVI